MSLHNFLSASSNKSWPLVFSRGQSIPFTFRKPISGQLEPLEVDVDEDELRLMLELCDSPRFQTDEIQSYCRLHPAESTNFTYTYDEEAPESPTAGSSSLQTLVWLDLRTLSGQNAHGSVQLCHTLDQLKRSLKGLKLFESDDTDQSAGERRLIYLRGLHPHYIQVLLGSASRMQFEGLRNAIYRYITSEAAGGVDISATPFGLLNFRLEFHLPVFLVRTRDSWKSEATEEYPRRRSIDLSFLTHGDQPNLTLFRAQISFLLLGYADANWTVYAFVDPRLDEEFDHESDFGIEPDEDSEIHPDPIAGGKFDADIPDWNPRQYFLRILSVRIAQIQLEWASVERELERVIDRYRHDHPLSLSTHPATMVKQSYDWALLVTTLLDELLTVLAKTNKSWEEFQSREEEHTYFSGMKYGTSLKDFQSIKKCFRQLERCRENLESQKEIVTSFSRSLQRILEINTTSSWLSQVPLFKDMNLSALLRPNRSPLYSQLSLCNSDIRLLKYIAPWTGATLAFTLVVVPLPKAPKYVALSYNWGQHAKKVPIRLNNFAVTVTTNLYDALRRLRAGGAQYVWADALCINQLDSEERSAQVGRMRVIFQKASRVAVWLGPEPSPGETGFQLQAQTSYVDLDHQPDLISSALLQDLLSRPYWGRVWIIQEVAVASDVVVYFGRCSISWEEFVECCRLYVRDGTSGLTTLLQFRDDRTAGRQVGFSEALRRSRSSLSTDPRDKLFALLGVSSNGNDLIPEPNYINSSSEVFQEFTTALIKSHAPLDYIYLRAANRVVDSDLPSWVPDWTKLDDVITRRQFDYIIQLHRRQVDLGLLRKLEVSEATLVVKCKTIDTAHYLGSIFAGHSGDIEAPATATTPDLSNLSSTLDATRLVFKTLTGVGLCPERGWEKLDDYYVENDISYRPREVEANDHSPSHETIPELLATVQAWVAANYKVRLGKRRLGEWWKILSNQASQIGDLPRVSHHFHNAITCGMRLLVTSRGHFGWAHPQAQHGDNIARIYGCSRYVLLRASHGKYRVVGDALITDTEVGKTTYETAKSTKLHIV